MTTRRRERRTREEDEKGRRERKRKEKKREKKKREEEESRKVIVRAKQGSERKSELYSSPTLHAHDPSWLQSCMDLLKVFFFKQRLGRP